MTVSVVGRLFVGMAGPFEAISYDFGAVTDWTALTTKALSITAQRWRSSPRGLIATGSPLVLTTWTWSALTTVSARATYEPSGGEWVAGSWKFAGFLTLDGVRRNLRPWTETVYLESA